MGNRRQLKTGFSLIELVVVVAVIAVIATIAIPRISRGATGAAESALIGNLSIMRGALDLYKAEHFGLLPTNGVTFESQLTMFTDRSGNMSSVQTSVFSFGPYLQTVPALPVGKNKGSSDVRDIKKPGSGKEGWVYDPATGNIVANTKNNEVDSSGVPYNQY